MCHCDYDPPAFYTDEYRKAGKPHRCGECCAPIAIGEKHRVCTGKWDGSIQTYRMCLACEALDTAMRKDAECWCPVFGGLADAIAEEVSESGGDAEYQARLDEINARIRAHAKVAA